jgi:ATP-dependent Clp protease ATP-binding subunit ClpC
MEDDKEARARDILDTIEEADDPDTYRSLRDQLYGLGSEVVPLLREELDSWHYRRRMAAATNLGRLRDSQSVPKLVELLGDPQADVREMALFALGIVGDQSIVDAVRKALDDYDADVRYRALIALHDLGYPDLEDVLVSRLEEDDAYGVREQALSLLEEEGSPESVPAILQSLLESDKDMQRMAEEALDRLAPEMEEEDHQRIRQELTPRERRLVLNYFESRNLHKVYRDIAKYLRIPSSEADDEERGLDKYGRLLSTEDEREFLSHAYGRDDTVELLLDHCTDPDTERSILLVGDAGVGKTAIIHEFTRRLVDEDDEWEVLETNTSELISGTRYLGDWETKLKEMTEAILEREKVILYLTNPNDLLGAGAHSKSDENFADFFKPYLHRGQLTMIAECTDESLKNGLGTDPGFLRLFRQVSVQEMSEPETLDVLRQRTDSIEARGDRSVEADDECLEAIADFARSFYTRSQPPGRACDLQDALVDYATRQADDKENPIRLESEQIPPCLSEETGISLELVDDTVPLDLGETRDWFTDRLIDQDHAVEAIVDRMAMIKSGMVDPDSPLGVYFLVGPTGVGKTYFAQLVAERIFGDDDRMLRFDLSEYQGRYAVEKLIGSPHDRDREGLLTEEVRNQPYSVLLFDEFEKADPEVFHLFLQILDEGRLTDARGETTDFRQTLIFLTSNLGASSMSIAPVGFETGESSDAQAAQIRSTLDDFFAPEFLNRLDDTLIFTPLSREAMDRLVEIEIDEMLERRGFRRRHLDIDVTDDALAWIEDHGFSERFGARELTRTLERDVLTPISRLLVSSTGSCDGETIVVSTSDGDLDVDFHTSADEHATSDDLDEAEALDPSEELDDAPQDTPQPEDESLDGETPPRSPLMDS